ncbi:MAG: hypothetical protein HC887_09620 [Desulfobacteraceae bacterium]|nr:hypothetical protein [Desulfobacteraceae bacterium]
MGETSSAPSIAIANSGNIYISGRSHGNIWETPINTCATDNIFVAKLNDKGERQWNTCIIACNNCIVWDTSSNSKALVVDMYENIYVSGTINTTWGSPINQYSGDTDAFIAKLRVPEVTISSPPVTSATVPQGTQNHILYKLNLSDAVADTTLNGLVVQTTGTYQTSDILNFKLRYSANATLDSGDATLSMKESVASGGNMKTEKQSRILSRK